LRFTGANRDATKYRTRDAKTQRFASGATAELGVAEVERTCYEETSDASEERQSHEKSYDLNRAFEMTV